MSFAFRMVGLLLIFLDCYLRWGIGMFILLPCLGGMDMQSKKKPKYWRMEQALRSL